MSGSPTPVPTPDSTASVTICHDISSPAAREGSRRPDAEPKRHPIYALWSAGFAREIIPVVPGAQAPKIEVLAEGKKYVVHGPPPKTERPYSWSHAGTEGGVELLGSLGAEALPGLTRQVVQDRLLPALIARVAPFGLTVALKGKGSPPV